MVVGNIEPWISSAKKPVLLAKSANHAIRPVTEKQKRMHRTIMNMVRSMIFACRLPLYFWGDAAEYEAYIRNRSPSKANVGRKSPLQMLTKKAPDLTDIVVFGSGCTVHRDAKNKSLGERGKPGIIIGRSDETKGYRVYIPKDDVVVVTQHVRNV